MFRLPPSRIALEDINPADLSDRINWSQTMAASQALHVARESPILEADAAADQQQFSNFTAVTPVLPPAIDPNPTNDSMPTLPITYHPPNPVQLPYDHLPYGPEREAIVTTNLHQSHLDHTNALFDARSAVHSAHLAKIEAFREATVKQLTAELDSVRLESTINNWRQGLDEGNIPDELDQAVDLRGKIADLHTEPILTLAGVELAKSASEPGTANAGLVFPPIAAASLDFEAVGAFGGWAVTGPLTRLYGAEGDVAVVLDAEADAYAGTGTGTGAAAHSSMAARRESEGDEEHGPVLGVHRAAALGPDEAEYEAADRLGVERRESGTFGVRG